MTKLLKWNVVVVDADKRAYVEIPVKEKKEFNALNLDIVVIDGRLYKLDHVQTVYTMAVAVYKVIQHLNATAHISATPKLSTRRNNKRARRLPRYKQPKRHNKVNLGKVNKQYVVDGTFKSMAISREVKKDNLNRLNNERRLLSEIHMALRKIGLHKGVFENIEHLTQAYQYNWVRSLLVKRGYDLNKWDNEIITSRAWVRRRLGVDKSLDNKAGLYVEAMVDKALLTNGYTTYASKALDDSGIDRVVRAKDGSLVKIQIKSSLKGLESYLAKDNNNIKKYEKNIDIVVVNNNGVAIAKAIKDLYVDLYGFTVIDISELPLYIETVAIKNRDKFIKRLLGVII